VIKVVEPVQAEEVLSVLQAMQEERGIELAGRRFEQP
jgi:hypothetical protein